MTHFKNTAGEGTHTQRKMKLTYRRVGMDEVIPQKPGHASTQAW